MFMDIISIALAKKYTDSKIDDIATAVTEQVSEQIVDQVVEDAGDAIEAAASAAAAQEVSGIIDSTLSTSGKAADAKATGDEISDLKDQLDNISAEAQTLSAGSQATATYSNGVFHIGVPTGADGFSPIANVVKVGSTATITVTDSIGTTTASISDGVGGSGGTSDYSDMTNKPKINNVELSGNKTTNDLGIVAAQIVRW